MTRGWRISRVRVLIFGEFFFMAGGVTATTGYVSLRGALTVLKGLINMIKVHSSVPDW